MVVKRKGLRVSEGEGLGKEEEKIIKGKVIFIVLHVLSIRQ